MRSRQKLVPLAIGHRRDWRTFWRYCRCGMLWRCPDTLLSVRMPDPPPARVRPLNGGPRYPDRAGTTAPIIRRPQTDQPQTDQPQTGQPQTGQPPS